MNTFRDFVAASQWIISERYSSPKFMAAKGQSAGALALGQSVVLHSLLDFSSCSFAVDCALRIRREQPSRAV
jgi:hypothetical protein